MKTYTTPLVTASEVVRTTENGTTKNKPVEILPFSSTQRAGFAL